MTDKFVEVERGIPASIEHPSRARMLSDEEFATLRKEEMDTGEVLCEGHLGTTIWCAESVGYVVEVRIESRGAVRAVSPCTVTPTFGMDALDGMFAEDREAYILQKVLGRPTKRLDVFQGGDSVDALEYLTVRGVLPDPKRQAILAALSMVLFFVGVIAAVTIVAREVSVAAVCTACLSGLAALVSGCMTWQRLISKCIVVLTLTFFLLGFATWLIP